MTVPGLQTVCHNFFLNSDLIGLYLSLGYCYSTRTIVIRAFFLAVLFTFLAQVSSGQRDSSIQIPSTIGCGVGLFNVFDTPACLGDVEVIFYSHRKLWIFNPMGGLLVANGTAMYLFAGISFPIRLARHLMIRLNFSPGYYVTFTGNNDLGFPLEFRTSLKLAWIFRTALCSDWSVRIFQMRDWVIRIPARKQ